MSSFDIISMAIRNLWKRKLRTFLTVLGVVIGTASIVVMISVGIGMNEGYKEQAEQMGSLNVIDVYTPWSSDSGKKVQLDTKTCLLYTSISAVSTLRKLISLQLLLRW